MPGHAGGVHAAVSPRAAAHPAWEQPVALAPIRRPPCPRLIRGSAIGGDGSAAIDGAGLAVCADAVVVASDPPGIAASGDAGSASTGDPGLAAPDDPESAASCDPGSAAPRAARRRGCDSRRLTRRSSTSVLAAARAVNCTVIPLECGCPGSSRFTDTTVPSPVKAIAPSRSSSSKRITLPAGRGSREGKNIPSRVILPANRSTKLSMSGQFR